MRKSTLIALLLVAGCRSSLYQYANAPEPLDLSLWDAPDSATTSSQDFALQSDMSAPRDLVMLGGPADLDERCSLLASPGAIQFPTILVHGTSAPENLSVRNRGVGSITITSITLSGPEAQDFIVDNVMGFTLQPGQARLIPILFAPESLGAASATLTMVTDNAGCPFLAVPLHGMAK